MSDPTLDPVDMAHREALAGRMGRRTQDAVASRAGRLSVLGVVCGGVRVRRVRQRRTPEPRAEPLPPFVGVRIVEMVTRFGAPLQVTGEPMTGIEKVIAGELSRAARLGASGCMADTLADTG